MEFLIPMRKYTKYFLYLSLISFFSCEKIVSVKTPDFKPQLVINGFLTPQERISVMLTQISPILDIVPTDLSVEDASISVFENGSFLETLSYTQEGVYQARVTTKPQISNTYHFEVKATGFDDLATIPEKIPEPVNIQSYTFENDAIAAINEGMTAGVFTWNFERGDSMYYGIEVTPFRPGNEASSSLDWVLDFEEEFGNICGLITGRINQVIPNTCLTETGVETIRIAAETTFSSRDGIKSFDFLEVTLYNISPAYYDYMKSIRQLDGIELAFSNPGILFTNAIGGYGVIGSFTASEVIRIDL